MAKHSLILLVALGVGFAAAQEGGKQRATQTGSPETASRQMAAISRSVSDLKQRINSLEGERDALIGEITKLRTALSTMSVSWSQASNLTRVGATVLLLGLILEILGATLLAGTHLIARQEEVFSLRTTRPLQDLALRDVQLEPRMNFLGSIGALALFLGFALQYTGTIVILAWPWWGAALAVALGMLPGSAILYYLVGQTGDQSRREKLTILFRNLRRNLSVPSLGRVLSCDSCSSQVSFAEAEIWWLQEPNSEKHPFLHEPYKWHVGHAHCLESSGWYDSPRPSKDQPRATQIQKSPLAEFLNKRADELKTWWSQHHEHWTKRRGTPAKTTAHEEEFLRLYERVAPFGVAGDPKPSA